MDLIDSCALALCLKCLADRPQFHLLHAHSIIFHPQPHIVSTQSPSRSRLPLVL